MTKTLEFHYDFSCPYAYLASTKVRSIADAAGATLEHRPLLLGGVFRALGSETPDVLPMSAARARLNALDMQRFAELFGVPLVMPKSHPNRTVTALRATLASGDIARASDALFAAYWREGLDVSEPEVIARALDGVGLDGAAAVARANEPRFKDDLRARTDEAVARGVFGAPACFVDGELFWGQDRLDFVAEALGLDASALGLPPLPQGLDRVGEVEFFYDFSSPFAYLASTQIERVATSAGARVVFRPFLLGALFKNIGTSNVPMLGFSAAKQAFIARDIDRHAKRYGVPFQFPSTFPIRSVTPLRVALAAGEQIGPVTRTLFHAAWAQDRDISSADSLRDILADAGHDPELVARTDEPAIKDQLRQSTDRAQQLGLCGAPSFLVGEHVFWGQDRLELVRRALEGWRPRAG